MGSPFIAAFNPIIDIMQTWKVIWGNDGFQSWFDDEVVKGWFNDKIFLHKHCL